jgi:hypothetical protein
MAQNPYLQNLLGIGPPLGNPMGLMRYEYTQPNYQNLLNQGLTASQIQGYDPKWATFGQFPYVMDPATNQVSVPGQAPGVTPITTDTQTDTVSESITPSGVDYSSDVRDTVSTPYGDFTSDDFTQDIYTYPSNKPMNQMTEQELMAFGEAKGYIDADGRLMGPMQTTLEGKGLYGSMLSQPAQIMNDKKYGWFLDSLNQKGMLQGGGTADSLSFAMHSPKYRDKIKISEFFNSQIKDHYLKNNLSDDKQRGLSASKIPGTFKSVQTLKNTYAPSGRDDNNIIYHTSTGGHYNNEGNFITGYGQQARYGSMTDAIDTITAAAQSGNTNTIPSKFDQAWYDKQKNNKNIPTWQRDELKESWKLIKDKKPIDTGMKAKYVGIKQKDTKKDYGPKSTAESTRAIKDKLEGGKSKSVSRFEAQERTSSRVSPSGKVRAYGL